MNNKVEHEYKTETRVRNLIWHNIRNFISIQDRGVEMATILFQVRNKIEIKIFHNIINELCKK